MSASDRNELADVDFADELAAGIANRDNLLNINIIRRMDPNLVMVLQSFQLEERVYERFYENGIRYSQLSSLGREDLELLGVVDVDTQDNMLMEFESFQGQDPPFSRVYRIHRENQARHELDAFEEDVSVLHMFQNQLLHINALLAATLIKVQDSRSLESPGVVLNNRFESHEVVIDMLQRMRGHSHRMLEIIRNTQEDREDSDEVERQKRAKLKRVTFGSLLVASGIIFGFIFVKHFRGGR